MFGFETVDKKSRVSSLRCPLKLANFIEPIRFRPIKETAINVIRSECRVAISAGTALLRKRISLSGEVNLEGIELMTPVKPQSRSFSLDRRTIDDVLNVLSSSTEESAFVRELMDVLPNPLLIIDVESYEVLFANGSAGGPDLTPGLKCYQHSHLSNKPCEGKDHICPLEKVRTTGEPTSVEHVHYESDGTVAFKQIYCKPITDSAGVVRRVIEYVDDVTTSRRAEHSARMSLRMLQDIIGFLPDPTFAVNLKGEIIIWNQAMEELTGISSEVMIGRGGCRHAEIMYGEKCLTLVDLLLHKRSELERYYPDVEYQNGRVEVEVYLPNLGRGGYFWFVTSLLYDSDGQVIGAIKSVRDISERKKSEAELRLAHESLALEREALEQKNIALRELMGQIEKSRSEIVRNVRSSVDRIVVPTLHALEQHVDEAGMKYLCFLLNSLESVVSPDPFKGEIAHSSLSRRELQVTDMIRRGMSSKDIANLFNVSVQTVTKQRKRIRKKLGISGRKINLESYLQSLYAHDEPTTSNNVSHSGT